MTAARVPKGAGGARIYGALRERILNLELAPGEAVEEAAVERQLGGSRTLVREALVRLAAEGLIEQLPNRGARVGTAKSTRPCRTGAIADTGSTMGVHDVRS